MNNFVDPIQTLPVTNYGTMTMENKQSASRYTLVSPLDQKLSGYNEAYNDSHPV